MEGIIFIISWIIIGIFAINIGIRELEKYVAEINHPNENDADKEAYKDHIKEAEQDVTDMGKEICKCNHLMMIAIDAFAIAVWPVLVPMLLYRIDQARKGNII